MLSSYVSLCFLGFVSGSLAAPAVPTAHEDGLSSSISSKHHTVTVTETVLVTLLQTASIDPPSTKDSTGSSLLKATPSITPTKLFSVRPPGRKISTRTTNLPAAPPSISPTRRFTVVPPHVQISTRTTYLPAAPPSINSGVRASPPYTMNTHGPKLPAAPPSITSTAQASLTTQVTPSFIFDPSPESAIPTPAATAAIAAANNQSESNDKEVHIYPVGWESTHYPQKTVSSPASDPTAQIQSSSTSTDILDPVAWDMTNPNARRSESSNAPRKRRAYWTHFFAMASPASPGRAQIVRDEDEDEEQAVNEGVDESECVVCPKGRDTVCIGKTHFGYCDEGCAEPRRLMEGTKCVDGRIYGD